MSATPSATDGAPSRTGPIAVVILAVLAVSHGAIFARMAAAPALAIAAWRVTIAAAAVSLLLPWQWRSLRGTMTRGAGLATLGASACLALHFATWISSLDDTSVSNSVILVNTSPIWVALFGWAAGAGRPAATTGIAIALAVVGASIIGLAGGGVDTHGGRGDLLALAGGAAMGGYLLFARRARVDLALVPYLACCYSGAALLLWSIAGAAGTRLVGFSQATWLALVGVAVVPQLIGHSSYNWALRYLSPSTVSITLLGEGVVGSALAYFYFREPVPEATWIGGPLVLAAIWLAARSERREGAG